ncbi:hypothetical protein DRW41_05585 [Neobacillus piezotolerans]|uniref:Uncharacterized protein n=1 Tax=Neobacillus piezotolerans TaxID=2259171 RepID=A0A3D8GSN6_9BACI|nr:hypothetical protein [Neobacillus piezotolerans]RDU37322.1 hypothetical protein DRW41_05585 [Neobacillus piezotolerans]
MGTLLFLIGILFEIAFATYCIVTNQNHKKLINWFRITAFAAFAILTLASVLEWSFRWLLLTLLLLCLAINSAISLFRNKTNTKKYKMSSMMPIPSILKERNI